MADSTIANLTDGTTADSTDRIPVERSPFGAGTNRYITPGYLATFLGFDLSLGKLTQAAGTLTTGGSQLVFTQTRNAAGTTFDPVIKATITDTNSAAGSLAMQILGGAAGTTNLISVSKSGVITCGVNFVAPANGGLDGSSGTMYVRAASGLTLSGQVDGGRWDIPTAGHFQPTTDNSVNIGSTTKRPVNLYLSGYQQLDEMTAPAGAANSARLFTQDNGAGKTQLMVIFGSGAAIQIAIEA